MFEQQKQNFSKPNPKLTRIYAWIIYNKYFVFWIIMLLILFTKWLWIRIIVFMLLMGYFVFEIIEDYFGSVKCPYCNGNMQGWLKRKTIK